MRWLTVDLPETMELRRRLLPHGPRQLSRNGSALDLGWVDGLSPPDPILVTAQGLFPYFQRDQVHRLIAGIAQRLPGFVLVFDVVPEVMLDMVRRASGRIEAGAARLVTGFRDSSTARPAAASTPAQRALGVVADLLVSQAATESPRSTVESSAREAIASFVKTLRRW